MSEEAPLKTLLAKVIDNRGRTCPTADDGMPLIATNCVHNTGLYPTFEKIRHVDEQTYQGWFRGHPEPGDLIFVLKGTPGRVCLTPDPVTFCIAQDMVALRADPTKVEPSYLFAALRSPQIQSAIGNLHVGSMIAHFKKGDFDRLMIPLPEKSAQKGIGEFYLEVSKKIELNRRMSATLEEMARALYRSWFVDFDPVHARALGQSPAHMAPTTAALFPDSFGPDGLPKGWKKRSLREITSTLTKGTTPRKIDLSQAGDAASVNFLRVNAIADQGEILMNSLISIPSSIHQGALKRSILQDKDVVFSIAGTIGRSSIITHDLLPCNCNQAVSILRPKEWLPSAFLWLAVNENSFKEKLLSGVVHAVQANLSLGQIGDARIPLPEEDVLRKMVLPISELVAAALGRNKESQTLATLRDTLLPRLMSGDLRIREAEKQVEEPV